MRILRAGSTSTSHRRSSRFSSRSRKISISAPVFSLLPYRRAGKTLVSLKTKRSFSSKYSMISLKMRCSTVPLARLMTIRRESSRFSVGCFASISGANSYPYCDNFMVKKILFLRPKKQNRLFSIRKKVYFVSSSCNFLRNSSNSKAFSSVKPPLRVRRSDVRWAPLASACPISWASERM